MLDTHRISSLPYELRCEIFSFVDVDVRINLIQKNYNVHRLLQFFHCLSVNNQISCFTHCIENKIFDKEDQSNVHNIKIKRHLQQYLPVAKYLSSNSINHYNRGYKQIQHGVHSIILRICSLRFMPHTQGTTRSGNLLYQKTAYLSEKIYEIFDMFTSLKGLHNQFIYKIRNILFKFMISIIVFGKKKYEEKITRQTHNQIKYTMKKSIFKPLLKKARAYIRRSNKREKQRIILEKKAFKLLQREKEKKRRIQIKEEEKLRKKTEREELKLRKKTEQEELKLRKKCSRN